MITRRLSRGIYQSEAIDFNLASISEDTRTLFGSSAEARKIKLTSEVDPRLPEILNGDPTRIRQVVANFVGNAIKFTPENGTIALKMTRLDAGGDVVTLRAEVRDSGCGIPLASRAKIFGRYAQADETTARKHGGTGLGLAISKQIIELMNGKIGFDSEEGRGSTFWFEVTLAPARKIALVPEAPAPIEVGHGRTILLAEDNDLNRKILCAQIEKMGFTVRTAANGEEAVAALKVADYDLVLMDCEMPVLDGFAATRAFRDFEKGRSRRDTGDGDDGALFGRHAPRVYRSRNGRLRHETDRDRGAGEKAVRDARPARRQGGLGIL